MCPNSTYLQEARTCNEHPCLVYHWQTGPWSQCTEDPSVANANTNANANANASLSTSKSTCSMGLQTRKVICVKVNVGQVPPKK